MTRFEKIKVWSLGTILGLVLVFVAYQYFTGGFAQSGSGCPPANSCSTPSGSGVDDHGINDDRPADHPVEVP
jgi:hypothetical protein